MVREVDVANGYELFKTARGKQKRNLEQNHHNDVLKGNQFRSTRN